MAITALQYVVMRALREQKALLEGASMLELGESNWYGDVGTDQLAEDITTYVSDSTRRDALLADLRDAEQTLNEPNIYRIAKIFFRGIGGCSSLVSIDPGT